MSTHVPSQSALKPYRGHAIAAGVLLIACTVISILSAAPLGSTLDNGNYLAQLPSRQSGVLLTALLEFLWAATGAGIAVALYPVLRSHNRGLALGAVAGRLVEGVFVMVASLGLLAALTLSQDAQTARALAPAAQAAADSMLAMRHWALGFLGLLAFLTGALLYYLVLFRARLLPRWLSGWGIAAVALSYIATIYAGYTQAFGFSTVNTLLNIPILVQEMVMAVWLIAKGFTPPRALEPELLEAVATGPADGRSPVTIAAAGTTSTPVAVASGQPPIPHH
ncbi:MAG: DUF4386 domain-containing protein [Tetrasphaera sp.]